MTKLFKVLQYPFIPDLFHAKDKDGNDFLLAQAGATTAVIETYPEIFEDGFEEYLQEVTENLSIDLHRKIRNN